jgi:hypothetical protein
MNRILLSRKACVFLHPPQNQRVALQYFSCRYLSIRTRRQNSVKGVANHDYPPSPIDRENIPPYPLRDRRDRTNNFKLVKEYPRKSVDDVEDLSQLTEEEKQKAEAQIRRWARLELRWLPTKVSLAQRVAQLLSEGRNSLALEMTRQASIEMDTTTVCWNHLIRDALTQKPAPKVNYAFKLFTEVRMAMKRRTYHVDKKYR